MFLDWGLQLGLANLQGGRTKKSPSPSPPDPFIQPVGIFGAKQEVSFFLNFFSNTVQFSASQVGVHIVPHPTPDPPTQPVTFRKFFS